jgi:erythronate-4-phosphate dehydrogenase
MIKIVADSKIPFLKGALEKYARVDYLPAREICHDQVRDADALIVRTRTKCNRALLEGTAVKYIATATIGFDHIDHDYCRSRGISWSNAAGCNSGSVMQYIASSLSYITSRSGKKFGGLSIGIVGVGQVGKKVERLARDLGMKVFLNDPPRELKEGGEGFVSLDTLLTGSDIVTMHVPLNREGPFSTFHLADDDFFTKMRHGAWFINTARGEVTDTGALTRSLHGHLAGAVIDVWEDEPVIDRELLSGAHLATPHIAGYSLDGKANGTAFSVRAVSRFFGLGAGDWYPENIPAPDNAIISIEKGHGGLDKLAGRLFMHSYNIESDSVRLKSDPEWFEQFRDDYPPRREFCAYSLDFADPADPLREKFRKIGFGIK